MPPPPLFTPLTLPFLNNPITSGGLWVGAVAYVFWKMWCSSDVCPLFRHATKWHQMHQMARFGSNLTTNKFPLAVPF